MSEWQSRQLDEVYAVVFPDGIVFKVKKDAKVLNKCVHSVLGITLEGRKEISGIWITENESASFWAGVCNELKNWGVEDILISCHDNLKGFSEAINAVFPQTEQQLCIKKSVYLSIQEIAKKWSMPMKGWGIIMGQLMIFFDGRLSLKAG